MLGIGSTLYYRLYLTDFIKSMVNRACLLADALYQKASAFFMPGLVVSGCRGTNNRRVWGADTVKFPDCCTVWPPCSCSGGNGRQNTHNKKRGRGGLFSYIRDDTCKKSGRKRTSSNAACTAQVEALRSWATTMTRAEKVGA